MEANWCHAIEIKRSGSYSNVMYIMLERENVSTYSAWMQLGGAASPLTSASRCHAIEVKNRSVSCYNLAVINTPSLDAVRWCCLPVDH